MLQTELRVGEAAALSIAKTAPQRAHLSQKPGSTRCYLTPYGLKVSLFLTRLHARLLPPGFAALETENRSSLPHPLRLALHRVDHEIQHMLQKAHLLAKAA